MTTSCPHCHALLASDSRFCTNCGTVLEVPGGGGNQAQGQVPPWASANPGGYYQQQPQPSWGGSGASPMESLGFASQNASLGQSLNNDAVLKKAILAIVVVIVVALASLALLGVLAAFIPGLRCLFLIAIVLVFLIPWIVYNSIRRRIRRTIGRIGWFF
jgi:hypothetical protein